MADLSVTGFISTPEIEPTGNISLEDAGTYRVVSAGPGGLTWVRNEVTSPYVHGRTLVGARKDVVIQPLSIRVYGSSASVLETNIAALLRAFEQLRYRINLTIDGVEHEWYCEPADYQVNTDGNWDKHFLRAHQQLYDFQIPREPTPIEGAH